MVGCPPKTSAQGARRQKHEHKHEDNNERKPADRGPNRGTVGGPVFGDNDTVEGGG